MSDRFLTEKDKFIFIKDKNYDLFNDFISRLLYAVNRI